MSLELKVLKEAAQRALESLQATAAVARYPYPKGGGGFDPRYGYSYDIPKEEQCRSALYRGLLQTGHVEAVELEWNLYGPSSTRSYVTEGEIDLVVYCADEIAALLEVKREWDLPGWNNSPPDFFWDFEKIRRAQERLLSVFEVQITRAGVVVFRFDREPNNPQCLAGPVRLYTNRDKEHKDLMDICASVRFERPRTSDESTR